MGELSPCISLTMLEEPFIFMALKPKFLRRKLFDCVGWCKINASYFIFHAVYNSHTWKFHRSSPQHFWRHSYLFSCSVHPCGQFSSTFEQQFIFLSSRSYCLFLQPPAHNILQFVMVCIMMSSWTLSFIKQIKQVQREDCTVRVATTLSDHTSWLPQCCTLLYVVNPGCCFETLSSLDAQ